MLQGVKKCIYAGYGLRTPLGFIEPPAALNVPPQWALQDMSSASVRPPRTTYMIDPAAMGAAPAPFSPDAGDTLADPSRARGGPDHMLRRVAALLSARTNNACQICFTTWSVHFLPALSVTLLLHRLQHCLKSDTLCRCCGEGVHRFSRAHDAKSGARGGPARQPPGSHGHDCTAR